MPTQKYLSELNTRVRKYHLVVIGLHQAIPVREPIPSWMHDVRTSFPTTYADTAYTMETEKFLFGQILARLVLGIAAEDDLPIYYDEMMYKEIGREYYVLKHADDLKCRNNQLRVITLKYLSKDPENRPPYELMSVWPSSWEDEKYLRFLVRFFEIMKTEKTKAMEMCQKFEEEVIPYGWFNEDSEYGIGRNAFNVFCEAIYNDPGFLAEEKRNKFKHTDRQERVREYVSAKGLFGLFWQLRNREAHIFEHAATFNITGHLSVGYVNFWRKKFPLLVTAAYLIAINLNYHREDSFSEFFEGPTD